MEAEAISKLRHRAPNAEDLRQNKRACKAKPKKREENRPRPEKHSDARHLLWRALGPRGIHQPPRQDHGHCEGDKKRKPNMPPARLPELFSIGFIVHEGKRRVLA